MTFPQAPATPRRAAARVAENLVGRVLRLPPATTDFTVTRRVRIPCRDGIELAADLYRPTSGAVGTVLVRGPYGRSLPIAFPMARVFAARGYHCLFVSSRGTFGSGGVFDPMRTEAEDGQDVVAWMTAQPWFTGTFATLGGSYLGHTQWALLREPPAELATAIVSVGPHDFSEYVWGTGAFRLDFLGWSNQIVHQEDGPAVRRLLSMATGDRRRLTSAMDTLPLVAAADTFLHGRAPWYREWVTRPDRSDPFWAPMQHGVALERVEVPVLLIAGWQDLFLDQTLEQYRRLHERGVDVALTVGPWSHLSASGALGTTTRETLDWLDEHLARRTTHRRASPVRVHVTGAGQWRGLPAWPPPTGEAALFLAPGGGLSADPPPADAAPSSFSFDPADPTPTMGGPLLSGRCRVDDSALAARADVLAFTGPPLERGLEVVGRPVLELAHRSDNPHADVFARLSEVLADGRSFNVTEAYLRLDPQRGDAPVTVALRQTAHRFAAGSRIRVLVAGGCHPQFARNLGTGENPGTGAGLRPARHSVAHGEGGPSRIVLPVSNP